MSDATIQNTPSADRQRLNRSLWFGLLNGPIVYSLYFVIGYFFAEATCKVDLLRYTVLGLDAISFWIVVLTVASAAITGYSTVVAVRTWQRTRSDDESPRAERSYVPFMAFVGAWLSGIFTLSILLSGVSAFFLVVCDWI